jgi:hypothetical protein
MMGDWNREMSKMGLTGPEVEKEAEEQNEFGEMDQGMDEAGIVLSSGFGNLYQYQLSYKGTVKATKYAIPVIGKKGDFKVQRGETPEDAVRDYQNGVAKGGDAETTFTDMASADKYLKEGHGTLNSQIWHVSKLVDLGPVSTTAPPVQQQITDTKSGSATAPTIDTKTAAETAVQAVAQGQTAQQEAALKKAFQPTEILKGLGNMLYVIVGVGVVIVIGGVAYLFLRKSPAGQVGEAAGGLMRGMRKGG